MVKVKYERILQNLFEKSHKVSKISSSAFQVFFAKNKFKHEQDYYHESNKNSIKLFNHKFLKKNLQNNQIIVCQKQND